MIIFGFAGFEIILNDDFFFLVFTVKALAARKLAWAKWCARPVFRSPSSEQGARAGAIGNLDIAEGLTCLWPKYIWYSFPEYVIRDLVAFRHPHR